MIGGIKWQNRTDGTHTIFIKIGNARLRKCRFKTYTLRKLKWLPSNLNLNKDRPELSLTRDWFILATQKGIRYSDYDQFRRSNIVEVQGGYDFVYAPRKTQKQTKGTSVTVPLTNMAFQVAARHGFEIPKPPSNHKMNTELKKLMAFACIEKKISSYDARRTYATLAYKMWELEIHSIMMVTGHKLKTSSGSTCVLKKKKMPKCFRQNMHVFRSIIRALLKANLRSYDKIF